MDDGWRGVGGAIARDDDWGGVGAIDGDEGVGATPGDDGWGGVDATSGDASWGGTGAIAGDDGWRGIGAIAVDDAIPGEDGWGGIGVGGSCGEHISETHMLNATTTKMQMHVVTMVAVNHETKFVLGYRGKASATTIPVIATIFKTYGGYVGEW